MSISSLQHGGHGSGSQTVSRLHFFGESHFSCGYNSPEIFSNMPKHTTRAPTLRPKKVDFRRCDEGA
ncbi:hypothetical protein DPMN_043549 [Dreissena polymorpha]|uniref:Uncharacterized protein n=1 Tax=Dreissena polymorpha TaxID=45954 RepID=A0A9D4HY17_DREPO|nr:hypothetical protein DPMN_043549 [Dreissena polymorpha]